MTEKEYATPDEAKRFVEIALKISDILSENGIRRREGMDCLALVIVTMMLGLKMPPHEAHEMADNLALCIKENYDLARLRNTPMQ